MPTRLQNATLPDTRPPPPERDAMLPVVDPHVRIDDTAAPRGSAADPLAPLRDLFDRTGGCHLLRAVHVQADMPWTDALADVARVQAMAATPGSGGLPNGIVACCDPSGGDVGERLDVLTRYPNLRGVRLPARAAAPEHLAPTDLAALERHDLLLELRADAVPIGDVVWMASARPGCRLVLDDTGPWRDEDAADDLGRRAEWHRLGPLDNVVLKLGHRAPRDPHGSVERLRALVEHALEAVGPERVMLAGGFAGSAPRLPWSDGWRAFAAATRGIAARRRNALFRTNAIRTYRL